MTAYADRTLTIDPDGVTIERYYFPWGGRKRLAWDEIRAFRAYPLSAWNGSLKFWGLTGSGAWFALDLSRPARRLAIEFEIGGWIRPTVTPEVPELALAALTSIRDARTPK